MRGQAIRDLWRLLLLLGPAWRWQVAGLVLGILVILTNVGLLALSGWFITAMGMAGLGLLHIEYFVPAAAIRALAILRTVGRYLERLVTHDATLRLLSDLRVWFYTHLEPLAPAGLQRHRTGDLLSRIRADIDSLDNVYLRVLAPSLAAFICMCFITIFLARFSLAAAVTDLLGLIIVGIGLPMLAFRAVRRPAEAAVSGRGRLRADIADTIRGYDELRVFGALMRQTSRQEVAHTALDRLKLQGTRIESAATGSALVLIQMTMLTAFAVTIHPVISGRLPAPDLAMIVLLVLASFDAVSGLPGAYRALGQTLGAARRIFEIVDTPPTVKDPTQEAPVPARLDITFRDVSFRYPGSEGWALRHINCHAPAGSAIGIMGQSGSGKTSLVNLILRFWEFQEGDITIGGVSIRDLSAETMRGLCSVITQQTHLFNTSIRENLRIAKPAATEVEMEAALECAGVREEVLAMTRGLDTMVGELGAQLSGGQARRIAIARAFLKDAPILILDEPTEGLDALSEDAVNRALTRLMQGRTSLVISHRRQTLRLFRTILHIADGRIIGPEQVTRMIADKQ
ncbi:thiol reductant ABC exporter subunit CydC [Acetobacter conturbans]|uniref:Thiol reductant ABC exporter subunit CydC n=1 Tax=Acetobacter conturbans TaxID=1737472 RepID=A0ABX0K6A5_9PROT|nr:thiol reductant ABC exporter subunit CydC [Acetobacter conturbans]NHN90178.1 thiol reductant ABC exporter subunit CydC [Acetobacter conturbans]